MSVAPRLSVVLPTLNRASQLARSAGSVLDQGFRDLELIVVDDGSTEDVAAAVTALGDPRARCVRRDRNGGVAAARNTGVAAARGEWLAFQDSDDLWLPGKLERQFREQEAAGSSCDMVVCGLLRDRGGIVSRYPRKVSERNLSFEEVISEPFAYTQTWLVRKSAVVDAGSFDERLRIWDDWDLLIRLARTRHVRLCPEPFVQSDQGPGSLSVIQSRWIDDLTLMLEKYGASLTNAQRAQLEYVLARVHLKQGDAIPARHWLLKSLRRHPARPASWAMLMVSLLGARAANGAVALLSRWRPDRAMPGQGA